MTQKEPGRLPGYEITFITKNELSDDGLKKVSDRVLKTVSQFGGQSIYTDDWGKRKLAYPIQKETRGHYTYHVFTGKPGVVAEIERGMRMDENVLRFLTVKLGEEYDPETFDKKTATALRTPAREDRRHFHRGDRDRDFGGGGGYRGGGDRDRGRGGRERY